MNNNEFEQFVRDNGNDILNFCKMHTMSVEYGNELYQDTMLKLLEKRKKLDSGQNVKAYALSVSIFLWKNQKKKYCKRNKIVSFHSLEEIIENDGEVLEDHVIPSPEGSVMEADEALMIQMAVAELPEKLRLPILLHYSSDLKITEIAECMGESANTIKTRMRRAKSIIKDKLEALGYDG
ncbi:MAG: RNA polymerase sigma factor [Clostridia bacterium]|nr:RNA polymerase sigma factor [Clostridia bacterium]